MKVEEPRYRASLVKSVLGMIVEDFGEQRDEILAAVDPEALAQVGRVSRTDWLPATTVFLINEGLVSVLGSKGFTQFWIDFSRTATRVPMLRSLAEGAARMFGSGKGMLKILPRSFDLVSRDLATLRLGELEAGFATIEISGFAYPQYFANFAEANRCSILGVLLMVGESPTCEIVEQDPKTGRLWLRVLW